MPKVHLHKIQYGAPVWVVLHSMRAVLRFWKYGHPSPASRDGDAPLMHCCIRRGREGGLNAVSMQCCCIRRRGKPQFVERTSMPPLCHQLWCMALWRMTNKNLFNNTFFHCPWCDVWCLHNDYAMQDDFAKCRIRVRNNHALAREEQRKPGGEQARWWRYM